MTEILLNWLNTELKLSKPISNIPEDFHNGYLFAELLSKTNQIPNLNQYKNSTKETDIIHNFCLLEKSLGDLNIILSTKNRNDIMSKSKFTAEIFLFKIKQALDKKIINYDTLHFNRSKELEKVYKKFYYSNDNDNYLKKYQIKRIDKINNLKSIDKISKLREKYKFLKLSDKDLNIIVASEKDKEVYNEIHKEIYDFEKGRKNKILERESIQTKQWNKSLSNINEYKRKILNEQLAPLVYFRDSTLNYLTESNEQQKREINNFNLNLEKLGLNIQTENNKNMSIINKKPHVNSEIIMMRIREDLKMRMQAKREKDKRIRKKIKEEFEMIQNAHDNKLHITRKGIKDTITIKGSIKEVENIRYDDNNHNNNDNKKLLQSDDNNKEVLNKDAIRIKDANNAKYIHSNNISLGNRVDLFKTLIPQKEEEQNEKPESEFYLRSENLPFNEELFFKSLEKENFEFNIKQSQSLQLKKSKHKKLITPIMDSILELVDEIEKYQKEFNVDLINISFWNEMTDLFKKGEHLEKKAIEKEESDKEEEEHFYDIKNFVFDEEEENEMLNYCNYIGEWKTSIIPNDVKGTIMKYASIYGEFYKKEENNDVNINEYEPTQDEMDTLILPKDAVLNVMFGDIIEDVIIKEYDNAQVRIKKKKEEEKEKEKEEAKEVEIKEKEEENQEGKDEEVNKENKVENNQNDNKDIQNDNVNEENNKTEIDDENKKLIESYKYIPIKLSIIGYPLSGKKTLSKLLQSKYPYLKIYNLNTLLDEKVSEYDKLQEPIESNPKYKTLKPKQIEQLQEEHEKQLNTFKPIQNIIQPYLDIRANTNKNPSPSEIPGKVLLSLLKLQLSIDFPEETKDSFTEEVIANYSQMNEYNKKIEELKKEEIETKKSKIKEIQNFQKEIERIIPLLYKGFIVINYPITSKQSCEIENSFTGYISDLDMPKDPKREKLLSYSNIIDITIKHSHQSDLVHSFFDFIIYLNVSKDEIYRRFNGIKYDPIGKVIYHIEDNPPNQNDKKLLERLENFIPKLTKDIFENELSNMDNNINNIENFYQNLGNAAMKMKTLYPIKIDNKEQKKELIIKEIQDVIIEPLISLYFNEQRGKNNDEAYNIEGKNLANSPYKRSFKSNNINISLKNSLIKPQLDQSLDIVYDLFESLANEYIDSLKAFCWFKTKQKNHFITYLNSVQNKFINFINRPSDIKTLANIYIDKYNDLMLNHWEIKNNPIVKTELTNDIEELSKNIWILMQEKKKENINKLQEFQQVSILNKEIEYLYKYIEKLFLAETKKFAGSLEIIKHYYLKEMIPKENDITINIEMLYDNIDNKNDFETKVSEMFRNCMRILAKFAIGFKSFEPTLQGIISNSYNTGGTSNVNSCESFSILKGVFKRIKKSFHVSQNNDIVNYEEEYKRMIRMEKSKFKFRVLLLKYVSILIQKKLISAFTETYNNMDNWITELIEKQNSTLNEFITYLHFALKRSASNISLDEFEFDSFNIYDKLNIQHIFIPERDIVEREMENTGRNSFIYNIVDLVGLFNLIKHHKTSIPYLVPYKAINEILIKKYFTGIIQSEGICDFIRTLQFDSYKKFANVFIETIEHTNFKEDEEEKVEYEKFVNIKRMFTALLLIDSYIINEKEFDDMISTSDVKENRKLSKDDFVKIVFWFEEDEYLVKVANEKEREVINEKQCNKILMIKEALFYFNKEESCDVIDLNELKKTLEFIKYCDCVKEENKIDMEGEEKKESEEKEIKEETNNEEKKEEEKKEEEKKEEEKKDEEKVNDKEKEEEIKKDEDKLIQDEKEIPQKSKNKVKKVIKNENEHKKVFEKVF